MKPRSCCQGGMRIEDIGNYSESEEVLLRQGAFGDRVLMLKEVIAAHPSILDLGAGPGTWEVAFQSLSPDRIVWHDGSRDLEKVARKLTAEYNNVEFKIADIGDFTAYKNEEFDLVFCRLALHHAKDEAHILGEAFRVLKPEGCFYLELTNCWRVLKFGSLLKPRMYIDLICTILYVLLGRKFGYTGWHLEWWLRRQIRKAGFEILCWKLKVKGTTLALLRKPA
jgi:SAM-dependent methyltransferase